MQESHQLCVSVANHNSDKVNSLDGRTVSEGQSTTDTKREIPDLSLQIPAKPVIFTSGEGFLQSQVSSKCGASSSGSILRGLSFKKKSIPPNGERSLLLNSNPQAVAGSSTLSSMWWTRCSSLPGPTLESAPSVTTPASARTASENHRSNKGGVSKNISRSLSVPGRNMVIVRSPSLAACKVHNLSALHGDQISPASPSCDNDEEIPEDEAICRICYDACEEGNTLKMECSCKGALQLIHEECAVKWFSTRRNRNCDVCGQEVMNLPVTLLRVSSDAQRNNGQDPSHQAVNSRAISAWQDFVVLVLISTICYFFFIEQLLIQDLKTQAVVIAAPFAFTLGLVASVLAVVLGKSFLSNVNYLCANKFIYVGLPGFSNQRVYMDICCCRVCVCGRHPVSFLQCASSEGNLCHTAFICVGIFIRFES